MVDVHQKNIRECYTDITTTESCHDKSLKKCPNSHKKEKEEKEKLPTCWSIHDSILNDVNPDQLGNSYLFQATDMTANRLEKIAPVLRKMQSDLRLEEDPEAIMIHCGINNLRTAQTHIVLEDIKSTILQIQEDFPKTKILWSEMSHTSIRSLNIKIKLLNAQLAAEYENKENVVIIHHTLRANQTTMRDAIHPNRKGTGILAATIGRAIRSQFWTTMQGTHKNNKDSYRHVPGSSSFTSSENFTQSYWGHQPYAFKNKDLPNMSNRFSPLAAYCSPY